MPVGVDIQLELTPNDSEIVARFCVGNRPVHRNYANASDLVDCTDRIRRTLNDFNTYIKNNPSLSNDFDKSFKEYNNLLRRLREHGSDLHNLIVSKRTASDLAKHNIEKYIEVPPDNSSLEVYVEDQNVTIPLGFAFDGRDMPPPKDTPS